MKGDARGSRYRRRVLAALIFAALAALLAADAQFQGQLWQELWRITGEEQPLAQWRGAIEYLGNGLRPPLRLEKYAAIEHAGVNPYGVNTFLQLEVDPANVERQLAMIAAAGFRWIRQEFAWEDIEIHGRGDFMDRRNLATVGEISAWAKYDRIVAGAEAYGLQLQARLSNPPAWSRLNPDKGDFAPPDRFEDFVNFAVAVAERYRGRIQHYQIWNEPNIYPEWGEQSPHPEEYAYLLCLTYAALKRVDPNIVVISGALAPTLSLDERNLSELVFLQRMYDYGAGDCFDVLSLQGYGLFSGPTDARLNPNAVNYARHLFARDLMVANGDAGKAIWLSEAAWNPVGEAGVPRDLRDYERYGVVTLAQAARYMPLAYERAAAEWPWLGVINYWFFRRPDEREADQSYYYFRMVEPDWRPLPIYEAMRAHIASDEAVLPPGRHLAGHRALQGERDGAQLSFRFRGTGFALEPPPGAARHGPQTVSHLARESTVILCEDCPAERAAAATYIPLPAGYELAAVLVYDRGLALVYPPWATGLTLGALALAAVGAGWRTRRRAQRQS